ncbi:hypothetical protein BHM03_00017381 [Ensete ventricosum]|nr:hypothetical protein BHM03_00017381 [Ensete ventricosum]
MPGSSVGVPRRASEGRGWCASCGGAKDGNAVVATVVIDSTPHLSGCSTTTTSSSNHVFVSPRFQAEGGYRCQEMGMCVAVYCGCPWIFELSISLPCLEVKKKVGCQGSHSAWKKVVATAIPGLLPRRLLLEVFYWKGKGGALCAAMKGRVAGALRSKFCSFGCFDVSRGEERCK